MRELGLSRLYWRQGLIRACRGIARLRNARESERYFLCNIKETVASKGFLEEGEIFIHKHGERGKESRKANGHNWKKPLTLLPSELTQLKVAMRKSPELTSVSFLRVVALNQHDTLNSLLAAHPILHRDIWAWNGACLSQIFFIITRPCICVSAFNVNFGLVLIVKGSPLSPLAQNFTNG